MSVRSPQKKLQRRAAYRYPREKFAVTAAYRQEAWANGFTSCLRDARDVINKAGGKALVGTVDEAKIGKAVVEWLETQA